MKVWGFLLIVLLAGTTGCRSALPAAVPTAVVVAAVDPVVPPTVTGAPPVPTLPATAAATAIPTPRPTAVPTATPFPVAADDVCGSRLPTVLPPAAPPGHVWQMPYLDPTLIPADVLPALEQFFAQPNDVSLVVYRVGYEGIGFYHNADELMPLASLTKLIDLVAYAQAVDAGAIDPAAAVTEADLARYYLPRSDLNAHQTALAAWGDRPLTVDAVATMMIRYSANSAADWLHAALGQPAVEQTAIELGLTPHSAPCPFLGRFLLMGSDETPAALAADPARYAAQVVAVTERYAADDAYRAEVQAVWGRRRWPSLEMQRSFVAALETRGTAADYADLMARIVTGQVGSAVGNALIRSHLEWPLEAFEINRERYSLVGYKNGTMPGMLTTAYYAWPLWADTPVVVALFYRNLPDNVYRPWRRELPNDALAHWLMSDPNAVHIMHVLRSVAGG